MPPSWIPPSFYNIIRQFMFQKLDIAIFIKKLNSSSIVFLTHTLKFIDSQFFKADIPYEAILKIKDLNTNYHKNIKVC